MGPASEPIIPIKELTLTTTASTARHDRTAGWYGVTTDYPRDQVIHRLFEEEARERPDAEAVSDAEVSLTYGELDRAADALARDLLAAGVGEGDLVGVLVKTSVRASAAILAVLKAGAAYVPLDPDYPDIRLREMCERVGIRVVITTGGTHHRLGTERVGVPARLDTTSAGAPVSSRRLATDFAYVIFTSGSTGRPKAVAVPHRGVVRLVRGADFISFEPGDTMLATANLCFDMSCLELFGALLNGSRVICVDTETLLSPHDLASLIESEQVTTMWLSAGVFHTVAARRPDMFGSLKYLVAGGDALNPNVVRAVLQHGPPAHFVNGYGPTENSMLSTAHTIDSLGDGEVTVPIGLPIANSSAYVLREDLSPAAPGEEGELYLGGDGVAHGYYGDQERTREHFLPDPFSTEPGARMYRTGDRARRREDGVLEFLGRVDRQVKIRGFRVELGELEHMLATHADVAEAVVDVHESRSGERSIVAWVVPVSRAERDAIAWERRLRTYVRDRLPRFMVPSAIRVVDQLPLNHSGKVDRDRLPDVHTGRAVANPPRAGTEHAVASIWCAFLDMDAVDREDDFFAIGGQSLQVTQVVAALEDRFGVPVEHGRAVLRKLLAAPTLREFSAFVDEVAAGADPAGEEAVDFEAESRLDPAIRFDAPTVGNWREPDEILLTGATGFFGAYLLDRLVRRTHATIRCLVRAADEQHAMTRIEANMLRFGLSFDSVRGRVVPVVGSLDEPGLGLGEAFDRLAERVDVVLHNGSRVNFVYPYASLRTTNVDGTHEVIRFAAAGRLKPVHYVSTIGTIAGSGASGVRFLDEHPAPSHPEYISMGYPETKWVSERLLQHAAERGLPVSIHRPYEITGASDTGVWNTDTMVCALFRTIAETGLAPDVALPLDFVLVDLAAEALVHMLTHEPPRGRLYHLTNPREARLDLLVERLRARGYLVREVSYQRWVDEMSALAATDPTCPLAPFMPVFAGIANSGDMTVKELYFADTFPRYTRDNIESALAGSGVELPAVDAELLDTYLDYFEASGFLTSQARAETGQGVTG
ncbi:amino acid adenylation domain-containing protein [Haloechinothrix sp. LS1_15]|uniref:amino acid adenylation domain-containing protein n=1 Tax=Haloechinothrix sp. LS1_15 TaxID=2652248 RepID=UPI00294B0D69|nr:amino acid adenylation domain-containing protein [Haloechinothrix sp. LS1_15]